MKYHVIEGDDQEYGAGLFRLMNEGNRFSQDIDPETGLIAINRFFHYPLGNESERAAAFEAATRLCEVMNGL